jgi:hypothetical protein
LSGPVAQWRKSSRCQNGECVEVRAEPDGMIAVRDSKDPGGPVLRFDPAAWEAHLDAAKTGELLPWRLRLASAH